LTVAPLRVAVATSGGRDSTALLHATRRAARALGVECLALHVHHGLWPQADAWQKHLESQCRRWGVRLVTTRLEGVPARGDSLEAWARRERYRALARMARSHGVSLVLLAHHRRDQAETFLLQALRGAGPAGLAAMPRVAQRDGITWMRPWLDRPREVIEAYVRRHRLSYVDDPSNQDLRFARNRLRVTVWPVLASAFADAESTLAAAAVRAAEASQLVAEVSALDAGAAADRDGLQVDHWRTLSAARRANLLRVWLSTAWPGGIPETLVRRLAEELPGLRVGRWPLGGAELRLYRGRLRITEAPPGPTGDGALGPMTLDLDRAGRYPVPGWGGCFLVDTASEGGVAPALLRALRARPRQGGERLRLTPRGLARSLKKQFQARGVPAWQRDGPLLYSADGRLLFVPGLGTEASLRAPPGTPQLVLRWEPDPPAVTGVRQRAD
jgi:tRNA(Ile)-lysidine synthase